MKWWENLPEWLRWILCWPCLIIVALLTGLFAEYTGYLATDRIWIPDAFATLVAPMIGHLLVLPLGYYATYYFVPRKQHYVIFVWCFLFLIGVIASAFMTYVYLVNENEEIWVAVRDLTWGLIGLIMSIRYFLLCKNDWVLGKF